jgi:hypothetical protein
MIDPKNGASQKLAAMPKILGYYAVWYPPLWFKGLTTWTRYGDWGPLATHLRFIDRSARKLARSSFHGMAIYQAKMERKQGFLFRCVDIVMELFAMSASVSQARQLKDAGSPEAAQAQELADLFCRQARRRVKQSFAALWRNEDAELNKVAARVMKGEDTWLEAGRLDMGFTPESFQTHFITAGRAESAPPKVAAAS